MKIGTEALLCAAQEQAIRTNYVKHHIGKTSESPLCRLCGKIVAKKFHWDFCKKNGLEHTEKSYEHVPEGAVENEVLWDINVQCDNVIEAKRPDIILIDKKERMGIINGIAVPADVRVGEKEREKMEK